MSPIEERRKRRERRRQELFQFVFNIVQAISLAGSAFYYSRKLIDHPWTLYNYFFFLSSSIFFGLWFAARVHLGSHLTFVPRADRLLVTKGLYAYFQHPIYYFGSLALFSFCMLIERYRLLWGFMFLIPLQMFRARRESIVLRKKFEDDYDRYVEKLWL